MLALALCSPWTQSFLGSDIELESETAEQRHVPAVKYHTPRKDIYMYLSNDRLLTCEKFREVPSDRAAEFGPVLAHHLFTSPRRPRWGVVSWRATGSRSGGGDPVAPYKIFWKIPKEFPRILDLANLDLDLFT